MDYRVTGKRTVYHQGRFHRAGAILDLSDSEAATLGEGILQPVERAPQPPHTDAPPKAGQAARGAARKPQQAKRPAAKA